MNKEYLTEVAYQYFPRGVNEISHLQDYITSPEFISLSNKCNDAKISYENGDFKPFYDEIKLLDTSKNFYDSTFFHLNDRAHNLQFAELRGTKYYSICLYISIIIPCFTLYVLETDISHALVEPVNFLRPGYKPLRNKEMEKYYRPLTDQMIAVCRKYFDITEFPEQLIDTVVPDINYQTIPFGKFTFFNAFFHDNYSYFRL